MKYGLMNMNVKSDSQLQQWVDIYIIFVLRYRFSYSHLIIHIKYINHVRTYLDMTEVYETGICRSRWKIV